MPERKVAMSERIERILLAEQEIKERIRELGREISRDYAGRELLLICVLKGAFVFLSDLIRSLEIPITLDFIAVSSYGSATRSSGVVRILKDLDQPIEGKEVLLVEDIVDTGLTLKYLVNMLEERKPASLKICALLDKPERRQVPLNVDYLGFKVPNEFVVGYGLDCNNQFRQLPYVAVLKGQTLR